MNSIDSQDKSQHTIDIPSVILSRMRLNKNFANVYTPFHEMEDFVQDLQQRKRHRKERRELTKPVEWD